MKCWERYDGMLRGRPVDHVPRTPILMQYAAEYIGSNYAAFAGDYRTLVAANLACIHDFGFEQLSCISDPYRETAGFGAEIEYLPDTPPKSSHPLETERDFSGLRRPAPLESPRMLDRVRAVQAYRARCPGEYSILGWVEGPAAEAADLRGVTNFLLDIMDDPGYAGALMDMCLEVAVDFARAQVQAGADTIGIGDAIVSQVSPGIYEDLIQPRQRRLVDAVKALGARVKLHICGNITHLLPGISGLQADILDVDHMVDMRVAREAVGSSTALAGNLDPVSLVKDGTPAAIRDALIRIYETVGNPFLVNAGCEIPSGTPAANLKALCTPLPYAG